MEILKLDQTSKPDETLGAEIVALYKENYPTAHREEDRAEDLAKRDSADKIRALLEKAVLLVAKDTQGKVMGLLEYKEVEEEEGIWVMLVWLIVDTLARGAGVSSRLHAVFEEASREIQQRSGKPVAQLLSVHNQNHPAREVYPKWGYKVLDQENSRPDTVFMVKDVEEGQQ